VAGDGRNLVEHVVVQPDGRRVVEAGVDDAPALDFAGPHRDGGLELPVDGEQAGGLLRPDRVEALRRAQRVERQLLKDQHQLSCAGDLRDAGEVALENQRAGHAAGDLDVRRPVTVRVIPVGAGWVGGRDGHLDLVGLPRLHVAHDVVGDAVRAHVQAVRVQIGRVQAIRQVVIVRERIAVRGQLVDEANAQHVAGTRSVVRS
jgi:hypothetical protein